MTRDRNKEPSRTPAARDTSPSPPAPTEQEEDVADTPAAGFGGPRRRLAHPHAVDDHGAGRAASVDDHGAGRAADAIPVVLDPFVLTLVPTSRAVRTVRRHTPSPAAPGTSQPADGKRRPADTTPQPADATSSASATRRPPHTASTPPSPRAAGDQAAEDDAEPTPEQVRDHLRRRAIFLRELAEARELRERVTPHRARRARIHAALRRRTFRLN
ncbi:hypothetical protein ACGFNU_04120 [Spirillospora sp. NPDC048911]|uniref:hypothetical protein n=1 Tax=Spirillospora sp. NPDC048911 TaxID=3364527 RepID=UPI0037173528